jgi:hypothetical protein
VAASAEGGVVGTASGRTWADRGALPTAWGRGKCRVGEVRAPEGSGGPERLRDGFRGPGLARRRGGRTAGLRGRTANWIALPPRGVRGPFLSPRGLRAGHVATSARITLPLPAEEAPGARDGLCGPEGGARGDITWMDAAAKRPARAPRVGRVVSPRARRDQAPRSRHSHFFSIIIFTTSTAILFISLFVLLKEDSISRSRKYTSCF